MSVHLVLSDADADELLDVLVGSTGNPVVRDTLIPRLATVIAKRKMFLAERSRIRNAAQ